MSSKKAKELRALALSLSIVNDDLTKKRYFRKSEYYKESDKYLSEIRAKNLAALELAKELQREQPTIASILTNVLNNAPVEVVGHGDDEEIKEGEIRTTFGPERQPAERVPGQLAPIVGSTISEIEQKKRIREEAKGLTDATLQEVIDKLRPIPEEKVEARELDTPAIRQRKALFEELINRKIARISSDTPNNILKLTDEELRSMNKEQINTLLSKYVEVRTEELFGATEIPALSKKAMKKHTNLLTKRLDKMEKQQQAEVELQRRARVIAKPTVSGVEEKKGGDSDGGEELPKPTRPRLIRKPTPPVGPPPPSIVARKGRGRRKKKEVEESKQMEMEDINVLDPKPKRGRGRPRKKKEPIVSQSESDKFLEEMLKERQKSLESMTKEQAEEIMKQQSKPKPTRIIERTAEAPTAVVGQGLKDYMSYMKNKKPTKDMQKLILLIGSKRAGNNSYKLNVEIEQLINKIKTDLEKKIKAHKTKLAKQELKAIAKQKRKLKIKAEAERQLAQEL